MSTSLHTFGHLVYLRHYHKHRTNAVTHVCSYYTGYSAWRQLCGLSVPANESELIGILGNVGLVRKLLGLYGTVQNIDVWVGGISEPALPGGRVGPLLACLLAKQFRSLREGDR